MLWGFADDEHVKRERQKAKKAKKSRWWQQKIGSGTCYHCGKKVPPNELTMDHVIPVFKGGTTTPGNVVPSCKDCNKAKGSDVQVEQIFEEWDSHS